METGVRSDGSWEGLHINDGVGASTGGSLESQRIVCKDSIKVGRALTRALAATVQCAPELQRKTQQRTKHAIKRDELPVGVIRLDWAMGNISSLDVAGGAVTSCLRLKSLSGQSHGDITSSRVGFNHHNHSHTRIDGLKKNLSKGSSVLTLLQMLFLHQACMAIFYDCSSEVPHDSSRFQIRRAVCCQHVTLKIHMP